MGFFNKTELILTVGGSSKEGVARIVHETFQERVIILKIMYH